MRIKHTVSYCQPRRSSDGRARQKRRRYKEFSQVERRVRMKPAPSIFNRHLHLADDIFVELMSEVHNLTTEKTCP